MALALAGAAWTTPAAMAGDDALRVATFNAFLNRNESGQLIGDLSTPDNTQAAAVAEIIQRTNPDVILLNEFDFDEAGEAIALFQANYLGVSQNGADAVEYPHVYLAPSNTGISSGFDLNNDGITGGAVGSFDYANDAFGFGFFPGQFAMVLLSKHPIAMDQVRTFQTFLWKDMPGALLPIDPKTEEPYYSEEELAVFRLSSKSHWDVPIEVDGEIVHILCAHPTPPVFDGPEDRNGRRNNDEIRFWADYVDARCAAAYIYDDGGARRADSTPGSEASSSWVTTTPIRTTATSVPGGDPADPREHPMTNDTFTPVERRRTSRPSLATGPVPTSGPRQ